MDSEKLKKLGNSLLPAAVMAVVMTFFSLYTVLMKKAMHDGSNPLVLALLRETIAVAALLPFAYALERRKPAAEFNFWPKPEDAGSFFLLGALMIWCVQLLSALSLNHISANSYALLAPSVPVFCLIVALICGYERFDRGSRASWLKLAAIGVTVFGAAFIAVSAFVEHSTGKAGPAAAGKNPVVGFLFLLVNKLAIGAYPNLERFLFKKYPTHVVVSWGYATGAILSFMSTVTCATSAADWKVSGSGWGAVIYSALISSALNYQLMAWVNKRSSPVTVMAFYPLQSVATPVLGFLILGATFQPHDAVGGLFIIAGLACLMYARYMEGPASGGRPVEEAAPGQSGQAAPPDGLADLDPTLSSSIAIPLPQHMSLAGLNATLASYGVDGGLHIPGLLFSGKQTGAQGAAKDVAPGTGPSPASSTTSGTQPMTSASADADVWGETPEAVPAEVTVTIPPATPVQGEDGSQKQEGQGGGLLQNDSLAIRGSDRSWIQGQ